MKKSNFFKQFVLMGILLFSGYLGFAQSQQEAIFTIILPQDISTHEVVLELEYRMVGETYWTNVGYITPEWDLYTENGITKTRTSYHLTGLEIEEEYEVRVRACIVDGEYELNEDMWSMITITMPLDGSNGYWNIICRPINLNTALNRMEPNKEEILATKENETTKENTKKEE